MTKKELVIIQDLLDKTFSVLQESSGIFNNSWGNPLYPMDSYCQAIRNLGKSWMQANELVKKRKK